MLMIGAQLPSDRPNSDWSRKEIIELLADFLPALESGLGISSRFSGKGDKEGHAQNPTLLGLAGF